MDGDDGRQWQRDTWKGAWAGSAGWPAPATPSPPGAGDTLTSWSAAGDTNAATAPGATWLENGGGDAAGDTRTDDERDLKMVMLSVESNQVEIKKSNEELAARLSSIEHTVAQLLVHSETASEGGKGSCSWTRGLDSDAGSAGKGSASSVHSRAATPQSSSYCSGSVAAGVPQTSLAGSEPSTSTSLEASQQGGTTCCSWHGQPSQDTVHASEKRFETYDENSFWTWKDHFTSITSHMGESRFGDDVVREIAGAIQKRRAIMYYNNGGKQSRFLAIQCSGCYKGTMFDYSTWAQDPKQKVAFELSKQRLAVFLKIERCPSTDCP